MKKISILSLHLGYGGIEKSVCALANILSKKYDVEIACTYKLYDKPIYNLNKKINIVYLTNVKPNKNEFKNAVKHKKLLSIIREGCKSIKILNIRKKSLIKYIKNTDSNIIISTRDIFDKWLSKNKKDNMCTIAWEHNHHNDNEKYINEIVNGCKKLDYLVVVSEELRKFYSNKFDTTKVVNIPNIVDNIPEELSSLENKRLVSVGRLSKEKGYMSLLEIFNELHKKYNDWILDIIGDGDEKEKLQKYIDDNKLNDYVILHGFQDKKYIDDILHRSSIYLMTSYTESFGIVLIEAMSHGIPCISFTSAQGANEIIINNENGYLVKDRNKDEYIKRISTLIDDYELRKKMGKNARDSIKKYEPNEIEKLWFSILE